MFLICDEYTELDDRKVRKMDRGFASLRHA